MPSDTRQKFEKFRAQGWSDQLTPGGHRRWSHPDANQYVISPNTPSDRRSLLNTAAQMKGALRTGLPPISSSDDSRDGTTEPIKAHRKPPRKREKLPRFVMPNRQFPEEEEVEPDGALWWTEDDTFEISDAIRAWGLSYARLRMRGTEPDVILQLKRRFRSDVSYRQRLLQSFYHESRDSLEFLRAKLRAGLAAPMSTNFRQHKDPAPVGTNDFQRLDEISTLRRTLTEMAESLSEEQRRHNATKEQAAAERTGRDRTIVALRATRTAVQPASPTHPEQSKQETVSAQTAVGSMKDSGYKRLWKESQRQAAHAQSKLQALEKQLSLLMAERGPRQDNENDGKDKEINALRTDVAQLRDKLKMAQEESTVARKQAAGARGKLAKFESYPMVDRGEFDIMKGELDVVKKTLFKLRDIIAGQTGARFKTGQTKNKPAKVAGAASSPKAKPGRRPTPKAMFPFVTVTPKTASGKIKAKAALAEQKSTKAATQTKPAKRIVVNGNAKTAPDAVAAPISRGRPKGSRNQMASNPAPVADRLPTIPIQGGTVGARIKAAREWRGFTVRQLAAMVPCSNTTLYSYERDTNIPRIFVRERLAKVLRITKASLAD